MERLNINEVEKLKKVLNAHFDNYTGYTSVIYIKGDDLVYDIHINYSPDKEIFNLIDKYNLKLIGVMKESEDIIVLSFKIGKIFILIPDEIRKELKEWVAQQLFVL